MGRNFWPTLYMKHTLQPKKFKMKLRFVDQMDFVIYNSLRTLKFIQADRVKTMVVTSLLLLLHIISAERWIETLTKVDRTSAAWILLKRVGRFSSNKTLNNGLFGTGRRTHWYIQISRWHVARYSNSERGDGIQKKPL